MRASIGTLITVFAVVTSAFGYWTCSGLGAANGFATGLAAPQNVVGSTRGATVHITWSGVSAPGAGTFGYYVERLSSADGYTTTSTPGGTCASSSVALLQSSVTTCDDSPATSGSYKYRVIAVFQSWTAQSLQSPTVSVVALDHFAVFTTASTTAGAPLTVTVVAKDAADATITNYVGTIDFTSTDQAATLPPDYQFVAGDSGSHVFPNGAALKTAGTQLIAVHDTALSNASGSANITVAAAALDHFVLSAPAQVVAGSPFTTTTVTARDAYGNTAAGWVSSTHCVIFSSPLNAPDGASPSYPAPLSCAPGESLLTFGSLGTATGFAITLVDAQTTALTISAAGASGTSANIVVHAAAPAGISLTNASNRNGAVNISCAGTVNALVCSPSGANGPGNGRVFSATLTLVDAHQNASTNTSGTVIVATITQTGGTAVTPASLSIPSGQSTSTSSFTLNLPNGSSAGTVIASANVGSSVVSVTVTTS